MASTITLSAGVRQNLLALQSTADLMSMTQNRLATGKRVNSALDNPGNFFTSQSLSNRARDLNALLDSIGQAQQTLKAADTGIVSLTKLVESAKSIAKQAQQTTAPTATFALTVTGDAIAADTAATATSTGTFASVVGAATASNVASLEITADDLATDLADDDTFSITYNGTTTVFEYDDDASGPSTVGNVVFTDAASLTSALETAFGAANVDNASDIITISGTGYTNDFTTASTGTGSAALSTNTAAVDGDVLTLTDGTNTASFRYVASGAVAADGTFTSIADLNSAIGASSLTGITAADDGSGNLEITSTGSFTASGSLQADFGFAATAYAPTNSVLGALAGDTLTVQVGSGTTSTFTFAASTTRASLDTWLDGLTLGTGITATINSGGAVEVTSTSSESITFGGDAADDLGLDGGTAGVYSPTTSVATPSTTRSNLQSQYNDVLLQITALARDAQYNGVNLLNGDNLKVVFNEDGSSSQSISGVTYSATGLGLAALSGTEFQSNAGVDTVVASLDAALTSLRTQSSNFGSTLTTVQTRQEFTKNLINTLQIGSDALVLADTNEEGANMLALQTRQQLSTTALSLSAQADQAVLRLF
jgi:flagellin